MSKSTSPTDLLHPAAAMALWAELRPDPPPTAHAFHARAERLGVRPHMVDRVRHYSAAEIEGALLGFRALQGIDLLRLIFLAGALGYDLRASASDGDDPPHVAIVDGAEAFYAGNMAGARRWLGRAATEYMGAEPEGETAP